MPVMVAGVGMTKVGSHWDKNIIDLMLEASLKALEDGNIRELDAIVVSNMVADWLITQFNLASYLMDYLGIRSYGVRVESACGSGGMGIHLGYKLVKSGARNVLVVGVEKLTDTLTPDNTSAMMLADDWVVGFNMGSTFVSLNALALRLYLDTYKVNHEYIMMFPVICHDHAIFNPYAQFRRKITIEDVKRSPLVADPLHLLESSAYGDGAAAILLSRNKGDVEIIASEISHDKISLSSRENPLILKAVKEASYKAYRSANIAPSDIDVLEIHDAFSITGILSLENLGFAKLGEGWKLVKNEEIRLNGTLPTNTFGGLKARGHPVGATGVYQVAEITLQLRGEAGDNQVDGAKVGLAENIGGIGTSAIIHILRKI